VVGGTGKKRERGGLLQSFWQKEVCRFSPTFKKIEGPEKGEKEEKRN